MESTHKLVIFQLALVEPCVKVLGEEEEGGREVVEKEKKKRRGEEVHVGGRRVREGSGRE